jgi:hypothetical protein
MRLNDQGAEAVKFVHVRVVFPFWPSGGQCCWRLHGRADSEQYITAQEQIN